VVGTIAIRELGDLSVEPVRVSFLEEEMDAAMEIPEEHMPCARGPIAHVRVMIKHHDNEIETGKQGHVRTKEDEEPGSKEIKVIPDIETCAGHTIGAC